MLGDIIIVIKYRNITKLIECVIDIFKFSSCTVVIVNKNYVLTGAFFCCKIVTDNN
jgi:hypothetical protein